MKGVGVMGVGMKAVHVVVPDGIDDPARPSGGNVYDRRVIDGLVSAGWAVDVHPVPGAWPTHGPAALRPAATVCWPAWRMGPSCWSTA